MKIYTADEGTAQVLERLQKRSGGDQDTLRGEVAQVLTSVRQRGDEALAEYALRWDETDYSRYPLEISREEIQAAYGKVDTGLLDTLRRAIENIKNFHSRQIDRGFEIKMDGIYLAQRVLPMERVGLYAPGGTAAYPSSVIMNAVPARIAGVTERILCTPARHGYIQPLTLVAACEAGVDRIFRVGGAQAVAAMAYGTQTIPQVDKICGPGNAYVAQAKRLVYGQVGIDSIAGPSEILIIADETAVPAYVAADMLSQAEHDLRAAAILVTDSMNLAQQVCEQLTIQCAGLPRAQIASQSLTDYGAVLVVKDMNAAVRFVNEVAPEHLEIITKDPLALSEGIRHAGAIFLGAYTPEPVGDYWAGSNHILPTERAARFSSALGVYDFVKRSSVVQYGRQALYQAGEAIMQLADTEGLYAHARAIQIRMEKGEA